MAEAESTTHDRLAAIERAEEAGPPARSPSRPAAESDHVCRAQELVDAVEAAAAAMSHVAEVGALSLAELNAHSDRFLSSLKNVHTTVRAEIARHHEPHTNEQTVYGSREALQVTALRTSVVGAQIDAMLDALPPAEPERTTP